MALYVIKLALVLALVCTMAVAALWLLRRSQLHLKAGAVERRLSVIETLSLGPATRLTVVRFGDQMLLLSHGRSGVQALASHRAETDT